MNNESVINSWISGSRAHSNTMSTDGKNLFSYELLIGFTADDRRCYVIDYTAKTGNFRTNSTSQHVSLAKKRIHKSHQLTPNEAKVFLAIEPRTKRYGGDSDYRYETGLHKAKQLSVVEAGEVFDAIQSESLVLYGHPEPGLSGLTANLYRLASNLAHHYRFYGSEPDAGSKAYDELYTFLKDIEGAKQ